MITFKELQKKVLAEGEKKTPEVNPEWRELSWKQVPPSFWTEVAKGVNVKWAAVSDDDSLLAYSVGSDGYEEFRVRELGDDGKIGDLVSIEDEVVKPEGDPKIEAMRIFGMNPDDFTPPWAKKE